MTYTLKFDGLFREETTGKFKNTRAGFISYGWLIYKGEQLIARGFGVFALDKYAASNVAEYIALIDTNKFSKIIVRQCIDMENWIILYTISGDYRIIDNELLMNIGGC